MSAREQTQVLQSLSKLYPFFRPYLSKYIVGVVSATLAMLVALIIPQVIRALIDGPIAQGEPRLVVYAALVVLVLGLLEASFWHVRRRIVMEPMLVFERDMRDEFYNRLQRLQVAFHDRWESGQLLSRVTTDLSTIRRWLTFSLLLFIVNVITVGVGVGILLFMHPLLGGVYLLSVLPIWFVGYRFMRNFWPVSRLSQDQAGSLATKVEQSVHGIRVLKAFGRSRHIVQEFADEAAELRGTEITKAKLDSRVWLGLIIIPQVTLGICLAVGIWLAAQGQLTAGELVAFFATAGFLAWPVESVGFLMGETINTATASQRVFEVFDAEITISDEPCAAVNGHWAQSSEGQTSRPVTPPTMQPATRQPENVQQIAAKLEFQDVHFRYPDAPAAQPDLLNGVNLVIEPGETVALVGVTGSGKTVLTQLVPRLYDVTGGRVLLNDQDVTQLPLAHLRSKIGMAFEDPTLFSASVRENVLMGLQRTNWPAEASPDKVAAEEALHRALKIAQADFVYDLPEGLDTIIGEEGMSLSGGQRQRLALARSVAASPDLLVLDDPLSALDVNTEAEVEKALRQVLHHTTALIIAHRPSTVLMADRVALLHKGKIVAVGKHADLLESSTQYRFVISNLEGERTS